MVTKCTINNDLLVNVFNLTQRTNIAVVTLVTFGPRSLWLLERARSFALCGRFLSCYQQLSCLSGDLLRVIQGANDHVQYLRHTSCLTETTQPLLM